MLMLKWMNNCKSHLMCIRKIEKKILLLKIQGVSSILFCIGSKYIFLAMEIHKKSWSNDAFYAKVEKGKEDVVGRTSSCIGCIFLFLFYPMHDDCDDESQCILSLAFCNSEKDEIPYLHWFCTEMSGQDLIIFFSLCLSSSNSLSYSFKIDSV